jgi:nicotinate-nucleotide adenylyltransferase
MAQQAAEQCGLARVYFVPAGTPPHRAGTVASYEDRFAMVRIACDPIPQFAASRMEEGSQLSYTVDTVERFLANAGPDVELYFIIGADAFAEIRSWRRWEDLAELVMFAVVGRPGAEYEVPAGVRVVRVTGVDLPISSSAIRQKLGEGDQNVELPPGVLSYIREHRLYETDGAGHNRN